jgi:hypothetical protein
MTTDKLHGPLRVYPRCNRNIRIQVAAAAVQVAGRASKGREADQNASSGCIYRKDAAGPRPMRRLRCPWVRNTQERELAWTRM